jgi:hypothetical protein
VGPMAHKKQVYFSMSYRELAQFWKNSWYAIKLLAQEFYIVVFKIASAIYNGMKMDEALILNDVSVVNIEIF